MKRFLFLFLISIISTTLFSQTNKTFSDSNFNKGDIIRVPNLDIELLNREKDVKNDSLEALVDFLQKHSNLKFE